jgi:Glycosyl hydrolase catalytic core
MFLLRIAFVLSLLHASVLSDSQLVLSPPSIPIPDSLFGMHIHQATRGTQWPPVPFKSWRLWDTHTTWADLEPAKGQWNFSLLDQLVALAEVHHAEVLMTLAGTPTWASARPSEAPAKRPGSAAEPRDMEDWRTAVRVIASRYRGRIHEYEIWNEPNNAPFWSGKMEILANMTNEAAKILKEVDASNVVVSPSPTKSRGTAWLDGFVEKGGADHVDVIGYHFYVGDGPPERIPLLVREVQAVLAKHKIQKPIWCTEAGWADPKPFPQEVSPGFVARSFILAWAAGISRFYWYAWDNHEWVTLEMVERDNKTVKPAGLAYGTIERWLLGAAMQRCRSDNSDTWICELSRNGAAYWIVWREQGETPFLVPADWKVGTVETLSGAESDASPSQSVSIGPLPVLLH